MADSSAASEDEFMGGPTAPLTPGQQRALSGNPDDAVTATITPDVAPVPKAKAKDVGPAQAVAPAAVGPAGDASEEEFLPQGATLAGAPAPVSAAPLQADEGLGFLQGLDQPFRNLTIMAHNGIQAIPGIGPQINAGLASADDALGLRNDQQFLAAPAQQDAAAAARGEQPGALGHFAGNFLSMLPIGIAAKNPWLGGAAGGFATTPDPNDPWKTAQSTLEGGVLGKVGSMATNALGGIISPVLDPVVQRLKDALPTLQMTSGQIAQGFPKFIEDTADTIPGVREMVRSATAGSTDSFNRALVNKAALGPIGLSLPDNVATGNEAIHYAAQQLSDGFKAATSHIAPVVTDAPLGQAVQGATAFMANAPDKLNQFNSIIQTHLGPLLNGETVDPEVLSHATSQIGALARNFSRASANNPDQGILGHALDSVVDATHDLVGRQNPWIAPHLDALRQGWAGLVRLEGAAGKAINTNGTFTPAQLSHAVASADASPLIAGSRQDIARGQGLLQQIASDAQSVLPSKVADSGTTARSLAAAGIIGGIPAVVAGHLGAGPYAPLALLGSGVLAGAYTKPVQSALRGVLSAERPGAVRAVGGAVRAMAPAAGVLGGVLASPAAAQGGVLGYQEPPGR